MNFCIKKNDTLKRPYICSIHVELKKACIDLLSYSFSFNVMHVV